MSDRADADGAALLALKTAMKLPEGDLVAVSVLAVYRTQCEHEARKEERERFLQLARAWREYAEKGRAHGFPNSVGADALEGCAEELEALVAGVP